MATAVIAAGVSAGTIASAASAPPTAAGAFGSVAPVRLLDTRASHPVAPNGTVAVLVAGRGGVPATRVSAVVLNVTVTGPTRPGFITAYASGTARPGVSNLNFSAGQTVPNLVVAPVGTDGRVILFNGSPGSTHLIADVSGYFISGVPSTPGAFGRVPPTRLLDTRASHPVAANGTVSVQVAGRATIPASGIAAAILNVTVTGPTRPGFITAYASGTARPGVSNLNFSAGQTVPNLVFAPVGTDGRVILFNGSPGTTHLIADVAGYFLAGAPTTVGAFGAVPPARLLDTRSSHAVAPNGTVAVLVAGRDRIPATGVSAAILTVTATGPTRPGFITAYASGTGRPGSSNLNFSAAQTVPNLVFAPVGTDGRVILFNGSPGSTHLIADVSGYVLGQSVAPGPVTHAAATGSLQSGINLSWTNPTTASFTGVTIRRSAGNVAPASPSSGTAVAEVPAPGTTAHDGNALSAGTTYSYALFAHDGSGHYAPAAIAQMVIPAFAWPVTGTSATGTDINAGVVLSWTNPTDPAYAGVTIRRAVGTTAPATPADGTPVAEVATPGSTVTDTAGLTHATTYTYAFFAHDASLAYAPAATAQTTMSPFAWNATHLLIDHTQGHMRAVSCPSSSFCAAVDQEGNALTYNGTTWTLPLSVAGTASLLALNSVSCPTSSFCAAVDVHGGAIIYNGSSWTRSVVDGTTEITSVSCPTSSFCAAIDAAGQALTYNGSGWGPATGIDGTNRINSVSCTSASFCVAVDSVGNWISFNGSAWSPAALIDSVTAGVPPVTTGVSITGVSCQSATFCVAVDKNGNAMTFNGTVWTSPASIDGTTALASVSCPTSTFCMAVDIKGGALGFNGSTWTRSAIDGTTELTSVSCASATFCVAVDSPIVDNTGNWLMFTGTWTAPASIDTHQGPLSAVSCATVNFCAAVDRRGNVQLYSGSTWALLPVSIAATAPITAVSCPTSTFCAAVDQRGNALMYNGSTWSRTTIDNSLPSTAAALDSVSCPTVTFCMAVDHSGHAFSYNGSTWSAPVTIDIAAPSPSLASVSCPTTTFCMAVDNSGNSLSFNGATWSGTLSIDGTTALDAVSCATTSFCAAVDSRGHALTYNGVAWSAPVAIDGSSAISAVSCPSGSFCVAVDALGKALTYNGTAWSAATPIDAPTPITGMSCPSPSYCVAVDQQGYAITGA